MIDTRSYESKSIVPRVDRRSRIGSDGHAKYEEVGGGGWEKKV